ncbi:MAG: hypothetical protein PUK75_12265 [bacterium]|nr:hypothetical protein [bacterium]MDY4101199.1 hypothetical protein [Lachnospiraceae bacterium]
MGLRNHVQRKLLTLMRCLAMPVLMMAAVFILLISAGNVNERQQAESLKQMEDTIHKAVLNCYAIEGCYPATIEYVEEYYGLQIDHEKYDVFYEVFAQNLMPEVTVLEKNTGLE